MLVRSDSLRTSMDPMTLGKHPNMFWNKRNFSAFECPKPYSCNHLLVNRKPRSFHLDVCFRDKHAFASCVRKLLYIASDAENSILMLHQLCFSNGTWQPRVCERKFESVSFPSIFGDLSASVHEFMGVLKHSSRCSCVQVAFLSVCVWCVCVCVRARVRACVRACVRECRWDAPSHICTGARTLTYTRVSTHTIF